MIWSGGSLGREGRRLGGDLELVAVLPEGTVTPVQEPGLGAANDLSE
jgi:hypothetical protein